MAADREYTWSTAAMRATVRVLPSERGRYMTQAYDLPGAYSSIPSCVFLASYYDTDSKSMHYSSMWWLSMHPAFCSFRLRST